MNFFKKLCIPFILILILFTHRLDCVLYDLDWHPSRDFLAVCGDSSLTYNELVLYSFDRVAKSLIMSDNRSITNTVYAVSWSKSGSHIALGRAGSLSFNQLLIYSFSDSDVLGASILASYNLGTYSSIPLLYDVVYGIDWCPTVTYCLATVSQSNKALGLSVFSNRTPTSLTLTDSRYIMQSSYSIKFHPSGEYIAIFAGYSASNSYDLQIFRFDASTQKIINGSPFAGKNLTTDNGLGRGLCWSPDGEYLAVVGSMSNGASLYVYRFCKDTTIAFAQRLTLVDSKILGGTLYRVDWSLNGDYITVGAGSPTSGYEMQVYYFDKRTEKLSTNSIANYNDGSSSIYATKWTSDSRYLAIGDSSNNIVPFWSYYKNLGLYRFDGSTYDVYQNINTILKNGDNARGSVAFKKGITVVAGAGTRLYVDAPICTCLDLRTTGSISLSGNLFLDSSLSVSNGGIIGLNGYSLILNGDIQIESGAVIDFASGGVFDGQGHNVVLGKYAQLLVDGGVTVTFKNMTIKNTLNTISCPPVRCMDWYSKACFDNVTFAFNDDWAFRNGQFFIHDDVEFTGTSKFSYRSVRPSYITKYSNLVFDPQTTFEYYPSTTDNSLLKMVDKTSAIIFDGSTLQATHTGIRLTCGSLYFDNKVTLSSAGGNVLTTMGSAVTFPTVATSESIAWSPCGQYVALGNYGTYTNSGEYSSIHKFNQTSLSLVVSTTFYQKTHSIAWSPNGKYIAIGNGGGEGTIIAQKSQVYRFNGSSLSLIAQTPSQKTTSIAWSPDGKYLAVGNGTASLKSQVYRFDGVSLVLVTETPVSDNTWSVAWSPDGNYLAVGNKGPAASRIYRFNGSSLVNVADTPSTWDVNSIGWSPNGKFICHAGYGAVAVVYSFDGNTFDEVARTASSMNSLCLQWGWDGKYIAFANNDQGVQIYNFYGNSIVQVATVTGISYVRSVSWLPDNNFIAVARNSWTGFSIFTEYSKIYPVNHCYDTSFQGYSNGIAFGNSAVGTSQDPDVYLLGATRIGIYGKVWNDSINGWNFQNRDSYISLDRYDSRFKITSACSAEDWKKQQIIKSSTPNTLFLQDNQVWGVGSQVAPEETFEFINNLIIPDGQIVKLSANAVIDGLGHDLILGKYSQLLVDGGVTVTFKNITIKNTLNTISCPPIRCMDWYSKACFDNVTFALNDDWAFRNGQFFIHNDVEFTGTSKFSYRSVCPSYVTPHSTMIFGLNTTFEYYPSTTCDALIKMIDKTSAIYFDGSTLQTTHTGIRLTNGSLYFDNKVTLSSADNTRIYAVTQETSPVNVDVTDGIEWSPDGRFLAEGNNGVASKIYRFSDNTLSFVCNIDDTPYYASSVSWSPNGKYIVLGINGTSNKLYSFDGSSCTLIGNVDDSAYLTTSVAWSPDGKYLAVGNDNVGASEKNKIYKFTGSGFTFVCNVDDTAYRTWSLEWRPDGKYLAVANWIGATSKIYSFSGTTCNLMCNIDAGTTSDTRTVSWSPDGIYLALANANAVSDARSKLYEFNGSTASFVCYIDSAGDDTVDLAWSPDGRYLASTTWASPGLQTDKLYRFDGNNVAFMFNLGSATPISLSVAWNPDGSFLAIGESNIANRLFRVLYNYDTSIQGFTNAIIFGNSAQGYSSDLDLYILGAARVGIYGKVCHDSVNESLAFQSRDSYISLDRYDSKFKITNASSVQDLKKTQIIKGSAPNTLFLQDNQIWQTSSDQFAPEETFALMSNLIIPENTLITFSSDIVVDGQNFDLCLGKRAQFFLDNAVTVTFKNLSIKNNLNTSTAPVIRCLGQTSKLCLDNVKFDLNDDFIFNIGRIFIHNDVEFTGTSKFSYRSTSPSFITSHANLKFGPKTTFEYYPSSAVNSLINMTDKTSSIWFDGATFQTTDTGIKLTKGSLYFDNKVTLSSSLQIRPFQGYSNGIIFGNSALGSDYDVDVNIMGGAKINVAGKVWFDNVN